MMRMFLLRRVYLAYATVFVLFILVYLFSFPSARVTTNVSTECKCLQKEIPTRGEHKKINNTCDYPETFQGSFEENVNIVMNYPFRIETNVLVKLQLDNNGIEILDRKRSNTKIPVFVTAASANHFEEIQGLIQTIHEKVLTRYENVKFIIYDLGLQHRQAALIKKYCKCDFRVFPFHEYPEFFKVIPNMAWKPVIIQMVLMEYDFVTWMDASIRLFGTSLDQLFIDTRKTEIKILRGFGLIVRQTHLNTFNALGEEPCLYHRPELQTTWIIISRTNFTLSAIMRPWVSCALQFGCMAQENTMSHKKCSARNPANFLCHRFDQSPLSIILSWVSCALQFGCMAQENTMSHKKCSARNPANFLCHRFDQSPLSIILTRLFHDRLDQIYIRMGNKGAILRGDISNYLEMIDKKWHKYTYKV